jgi:FkbM family methyltransferase
VDLVRVPYGLSVDAKIREVIKTYSVDTIIDVGANEGQFARRMREMGFRGHIHSFEPVSNSYEILKANARGDECWFCHNVALGRTAGTASINVSEKSYFSSFLQPNQFGCEQFGDIKIERTEKINVTTVDQFLRASNITSKNIFLKMDTQGWDLEVFAGAKGSIDKIIGIVSELSFVSIYEKMKDYKEALGEYEECGFHVSGFYLVNNAEDLSLIEADCVMIRK